MKAETFWKAACDHALKSPPLPTLADKAKLEAMFQAINVAKTIACLEQSVSIEDNHILESINYTRPIAT